MVSSSMMLVLMIGMPFSRATSATGDGVTILFRPNGASGRVMTSSISMPALTSPCKVCAALAGVPAKIIDEVICLEYSWVIDLD